MEKNPIFHSSLLWKRFNIILLTMKLLTVLIFAGSMAVSASTYSQRTKINLQFENSSLTEILGSIEKNSEFIFVYNANIVNSDLKRSISVKEETIEKVLTLLFQGIDISYKIDDRQVFLYKKELQKKPESANEIIKSDQPQKKEISGMVKDDKGLPLPGVSVIVKGTTTGIVTDNDGKFTLLVPMDAKALVFSFLGMKAQEIVLGNKTTINISMEEEMFSVDEVVVVGYGIVKKSDLTGSVSSIKNDEMMRNRPVSVEQGIQGRLSGVNVIKNDGAPGGGISMQIRGTNSFLGGTQPLYVIDGVPMSTSNNQETINFNSDTEVTSRNALSFLDPNDIETIEVLKDGSSVAIYGSQGANGVVMITTKSGKVGKDKLHFEYNMTIGTVAKKLRMLGASEYAGYRNQSFYNTQLINSGTAPNPVNLPFPGVNGSDGEDLQGPSDFDNDPYYWQDVIFRTAKTKNYSVSYSGANKGFDYAVGVAHLDQEGTVINSKYKRTTLKINLNRQVKDWIKIGTSTNISTSESDMLKTATKNRNNGDEGVIRSAIYFPSTYKVEDEITSGEYSIVTNPKNYADALNKNKNYNVYTTNYANITLAKGLIYRMVAGFNFSLNSANRYFPRNLYEGKTVNGLSQAGDNTWQSTLWDNLLMYNRTFGKHNINATLGTSWQGTNYYNKMIITTGFGSDSNNGWILGDGAKPDIPKSAKGESQLWSYIFRAAYTYDGRYFLTTTFRRDASSKFAINNKIAYFPSVGLGWRVSKESFMKDSEIFTNLKLRYSYGMAGNSGIDSYGSLSLFMNANYPFGNNVNNGYAPDPTKPGNNSLKWETTYQHDIGVDISLFKKVEITIDYYDKLTKDLIQNRKQPPSSGVESVLTNMGSVRNSGFEAAVSMRIINNKNFVWSAGANFSINKNRVVDMIETIFPNQLWNDMRPFIITNDKPIGQLYGLIEDGIWGSRDEVINSAQFQKVYPGYTVGSNTPATETLIKQKWVGEIRFKDLDNSGDISESDRDFIGDVNPDFIYSFNMNFTVKNFDFSFMVNSVKGNDIINMSSMRFNDIGQTRNILKSVYDNAWTPENGGTNAKIYTDSGRKLQFTRRFIEDGSYLKLRNVSIGYTIPNPIKGIVSLRAYFSTNNLLTLTNYSGYDPEVNAFGSDPSQRGVDAGGYPQSRESTFGVSLTF